MLHALPVLSAQRPALCKQVKATRNETSVAAALPVVSSVDAQGDTEVRAPRMRSRL